MDIISVLLLRFSALNSLCYKLMAKIIASTSCVKKQFLMTMYLYTKLLVKVISNTAIGYYYSPYTVTVAGSDLTIPPLHCKNDIVNITTLLSDVH